jgi:hypothetical protein
VALTANDGAALKTIGVNFHEKTWDFARGSPWLAAGIDLISTGRWTLATRLRSDLRQFGFDSVPGTVGGDVLFA